MNIGNLKATFIDNKIYRKDELISSINSVIGYVREYKFYGRIESIIYIIAGFTDEKITKTMAENFINSGLEYAEKNYDGRGLGNNSGLISITVLIGKDIDQTVIDFFKHKSRIHMSVREIPILYDIDKDEFYKPKFLGFSLMGLLFLKYYLKLTNEVMNMVKIAAIA